MCILQSYVALFLFFNANFDVSVVNEDDDFDFADDAYVMDGGFRYYEHDDISSGREDYYMGNAKFAFRCKSWTSKVPFCMTVMSAESYRP